MKIPIQIEPLSESFAPYRVSVWANTPGTGITYGRNVEETLGAWLLANLHLFTDAVSVAMESGCERAPDPEKE